MTNEIEIGDLVGLGIEGSAATITMRRAPVNALNDALQEQFGRALNRVEEDDGLSVLRIRSAEKAFCAGADLEFMASRFDNDAGRAELIDSVAGLQALFARLESSGKVTLAEINGPAMGGGMEMALACDLRMAATEAKMGLPEARLGLLPGAGGTQRLTRICGEAVARRLILGAEIVDGAKAAKLGLVHWAVPGEDLSADSDALVSLLGKLPATAVAECKTCIAAGLDPAQDGFAEELAATLRLLSTDETQSRVREFLDGVR